MSDEHPTAVERTTSYIATEHAAALEEHLPEVLRKAVRTHAEPTVAKLEAAEKALSTATPSRLNSLAACAKDGAIGGTIIGAALGAASAVQAYRHGTMSGQEALAHTSISAVKGGAQGTAVVVGGAVVRAAAMRAGVKVLARGTAPVAIAATALECGNALLDYRRGSISGAKCAEKCGEAAASGAGGWAGTEIGIAAGACIGPPGMLLGAVVGGIVGSLVASRLFRSSRRR